MTRILLALGWLIAAPAAAADQPEMSENDRVFPHTEPEPEPDPWARHVRQLRIRMIWGGAMMGTALALTRWQVLPCKNNGTCQGFYIAVTAPLAIWGGFKMGTALGGTTSLLRQQGMTGWPLAYWIGWTGAGVMTAGWFLRVWRSDIDPRIGTLIAAGGSALAIGGFGTQALRNIHGSFRAGNRGLLPQVQLAPLVLPDGDRTAVGLGLATTW